MTISYVPTILLLGVTWEKKDICMCLHKIKTKKTQNFVVKCSWRFTLNIAPNCKQLKCPLYGEQIHIFCYTYIIDYNSLLKKAELLINESQKHYAMSL